VQSNLILIYLTREVFENQCTSAIKKMQNNAHVIVLITPEVCSAHVTETERTTQQNH